MTIVIRPSENTPQRAIFCRLRNFRYLMTKNGRMNTASLSDTSSVIDAGYAYRANQWTSSWTNLQQRCCTSSTWTAPDFLSTCHKVSFKIPAVLKRTYQLFDTGIACNVSDNIVAMKQHPTYTALTQTVIRRRRKPTGINHQQNATNDAFGKYSPKSKKQHIMNTVYRIG